MANTAEQYLAQIAPQYSVRNNWLSLSADLVIGNTISVAVNGQTAQAVFVTDSNTTLNNLKTSLAGLPAVKTAVLSGLVFTIEINATIREDILLSGTITGGTQQEVITIGEYYNSTRDAFLLLACEQTNKCWYGSKYEYAKALRTAHLLYLDEQAQALIDDPSASISNGVVESLKQDQLAITYGAISEIKSSSDAIIADLSRTPYGITLLAIRKSANTSMMSTGAMNLCL